MNRHSYTLEERQEQMRSRRLPADRQRAGTIIPLYGHPCIAGRIHDQGQKYAVIFDNPSDHLPVVLAYTNEPSGASYLNAAKTHRTWRYLNPRVVQIRRRRCFKTPVCLQLDAWPCGSNATFGQMRCSCICHLPEPA